MTTKLTDSRGDERIPAEPVINDRYRVLERLGEGGQGAVFRVADLFQAGRVKVLKAPHAQASAGEVERLRWEFVRLARLEHSRLLRVFDLDVVEQGGGVLPCGQVFFTAEHAPGVHPAELMERLGQRRRTELLWRIATDVASALDHIHGRGLLHGDVKPENLLCTAEGDVKLLDLGLSTVIGALGDGTVAGTLSHLAPEALAGCPDERSDLYALGSCLYTVASGQLPRQVPTGASGVTTPAAQIRALLEQDPAPLSEVAPGLPAKLCALVDQLLARDPEARPRSARVLIEQIARLRRTVSLALTDTGDGLPLLATGVVGREAQVSSVVDVVGARLQAAAEPAGPPATVVLRGEPGVGRATVALEAIRSLQLEVARGAATPFGQVSGLTLAEAANVVLDGAGAPPEDDAALVRLLSGLERVVATRPLVLVIEEGDADASVLRRLFSIMRRDPSLALGRLALLLRCRPETPLDAEGLALQITVPPLERDELGELATRALGGAPPAAFLTALLRASRGVPALAHELLRAAWEQVADRQAVPDVDLATLSDQGLMALARARLQRLPAVDRQLARAIAVAGAPIPLEWAAEVVGLEPVSACEALERLQQAGILVVEDGKVRVLHRSLAEALCADVAPGDAQERETLHRRFADRYREPAEAGDEAALLQRIRHLAVAPPCPELPSLVQRAAARARERGEVRRAASLLELATPWVAEDERGPFMLELAEAQVRGGDYAQGTATLDGLAHGAGAGVALRVATLRGLALQRQGALAEARTVLETALGDRPPDGEAAAEAAALLGRVLLAQGEAAAARASCPRLEDAPEGVVGLPLLEVGGLAAYYAGEREEAARFFAEAITRARAADATERLPRALGCDGMVRQASGDLAGAADRYEEAMTRAEAGGDLHGAAHYAANLGSVLREQGRLAEALSPSVAAVRRMVQLGHTAELPVAIYNLGNLLLTLGDLQGTSRELSLLHTEAARRGTPIMEGYLHLLAAELSRRLRLEGRPAPRGLPESLRRAPAALARAAAERFGEAGAVREAVFAELTTLEGLAAEGRAEAAVDRLAEVEAAVRRLDDPLAVHLSHVARARIALAGGAVPEARQGVEAAWAYFEATGLPDLAWRAGALAAALARRAGDDGALRRHTEAAADLARAQRELLPESYRAGWDRDPDAVALARLERRLATAAAPSDSALRVGSSLSAEPEAVVLRRLLDINKRLNSELRLPILLELVLDAVLDLIDAERGFVLLRNEAGDLEVRIARNMDRQTLQPGELSLSQSIAEEAAARGEPVVTVDAAMDARFSNAVSVHGLRLRSVLAVPLRVKGLVQGTVYVDNRLRRGAFTDSDLRLVQDFAQQAAIAIENARLHAELSARREEIESLNESLASKVARQEAEIAEMRTELKESQAALQVRYDYSNIVGNTPRMLELFHLLDRITDVDLPVVIHGESGTGKELVARAIHFNGPRKQRPFVSENCGAVPETLLESILFGHVKGAFTGADRDRRGLFEVAHGGTLFLDEVGEMSPAMQTKLLRVLQDGELRRVGGDRVVTVDVRIIAASNRKLDTLVAEGVFRQDLFYRLNVLAVELPQLRQRVDDIPMLVTHFVGKYSPDRERRFSRSALERLMAYPWPGNVRELENEIQRALALGGDLIGDTDLSPQIRGASGQGRLPDDLDLRQHVEILERDLLGKAMDRTRGNQTRAAKLLGLSRYGLLKKLRRYAMLPGGERERQSS